MRLPTLVLFTAACCATSVGGVPLHAAPSEAEESAFFESKIRPVLVDRCYACHSAEAAKAGKLKGGLQLDSRAGLLAGGDSGPAIVPKRPRESLLLDALKFDGLEMPPEGRLPEAVVADFTRWIERGAFDPRDAAPATVRRGLSLDEGRRFWSFRPIVAHAPPEVRNAAWPLTPIDRFILAAQEAAGLTPVADAEPRTLIRRLYFDLIGLPPSPEEVEEFVAACRTAGERSTVSRSTAARTKSNSVDEPDASDPYVALVDRLLASPHFGERWGRHWLDAARFAESNGKDRNMVWHHAWRYRDWVIDAFNCDLPYDEFVRDQIAGDLRGGATVEERDRRRTAVGFLALGPKALAETKRDLFRMDLIDEQLDVVGKSMLGLSIACARCHDHKFDPIPTSDYYALAGILRSTDALYGDGPRGIKGLHDSGWAVLGEPAAEVVAAANEHAERLKLKTQERNDGRSSRYRIVRRRADSKLQLAKPGADVAAIEAEMKLQDEQIAEWDAKIKLLEEEVKRLETEFPPQPLRAMSARDAEKPTDVAIHVRGDVQNLGDRVPRGVLQVVDAVAVRPIAAGESGRLQWADWLADRAHPLTPRVAVNRIWLHLFGRGLVSTPEDFGVNGARPSHPELLDYLAARFTADGWSTKRLLRTLVLSRTYRLSSVVDRRNQELDPDDVRLWRHAPRRWEAEAYRDAVLSVAGRLDLQPPSRSYLGDLPLYEYPEFVSTKVVQPEALEHSRRSIYLSIIRGNLPETLRLFDMADPSVSTAQRDETIVPAQASFLMNSTWLIAQAEALADRLAHDVGNVSDVGSVESVDAARLDRLYALALGRRPTETERRRAAEFISRAAATDAARRAAWVSLCQALLACTEFRYSL